MNTVLVHDHLNQIGGAERVLAEFHALYPQSPIYTLLYDEAKAGAFTKGWDIRTSFIEKLPGGKKFFKWFLPLMPTAVEQLDLSAYDLVISSASALIKGVIPKPSAVHVCYCHTPTRYLWSDTREYVNDLHNNNFVKKILPFILTKLRQWDYLAAQRVDYFVANSNFVRKRIAKYYRREATVLYPPINIEAYQPHDTMGDYFLIISRLRPYKKIDIAVQAFNKLNIPLKIIGIGDEASELRASARSHIEFLGQVSEAEKIKYLVGCRALLHPQEEDFGITMVEAMASGRPVIAYGAGGALEVVEDGKTGMLFKEQSWEALANCVIRFNRERFDAQYIANSAQRFSVKRFEEQWNLFLNTKVKF